MPSVGAEAYAFSEFGNAVTFTGKNRSLNSVTVTMSSFGCVTGHWYSADCSTPSGATFSVPITFNVYSADGTQKLASATQTFAIPYRPSASSKCPVNADGSRGWYDNALKSCFNGDAVNITFSFAGQTMLESVVFGISYNTTHYGPSPVGQSAPCFTSAGGCGYDSLNVALSKDPTDLSAGENTVPGTVWQNASYGQFYCDGGAAGTGSFRLDSPNVPSCWGVQAPYNTAPFYMPSVQFKAAG